MDLHQAKKAKAFFSQHPKPLLKFCLWNDIQLYFELFWDFEMCHISKK